MKKEDALAQAQEAASQGAGWIAGLIGITAGVAMIFGGIVGIKLESEAWLLIGIAIIAAAVTNKSIILFVIIAILISSILGWVPAFWINGIRP